MKYNLTKYPLFLLSIYDFCKITSRIFQKPLPLYSELFPSPFFIVSSGRSGTTLLRSILINNPDVSIPPESYVISSAIRKFYTYRILDWEDLVKIIVGEFEQHVSFKYWQIDLKNIYRELLSLQQNERSLAVILDKIYRYYIDQKTPGAHLWGDKTPKNVFYLKWINKVFRDAKFIHLVRDGRDVVNSYLKKNPELRLKEACTRWNKSIEKTQSFKKEKDKQHYLEIKYEQLVQNPEKTIRLVCNFLGISYTQEMLDFTSVVDNLGDGNLQHHTNLKNPINTKSIGKWKYDLDKTQISEISRLLNKNLKSLGYI